RGGVPPRLPPSGRRNSRRAASAPPPASSVRRSVRFPAIARACSGPPRFRRPDPTESRVKQPPLARPVAGQRDPVHDAPVAVVVVDRVVLRAAVVPERNRADAPRKAAGKFRPDLLLEEKSQQRRALLLGHALEAHSV